MKKIYVNEEWCLGCHLCEYYCAYANSGKDDMVKALKDIKINPRIRVEGNNNISFAISCRHCEEPNCVMSCITGAMYMDEDGTVRFNEEKCVGCYTCILVCPYGSVMPNGEEHGVIQKCELCMNNSNGTPACAQHCPNKAIVYTER